MSPTPEESPAEGKPKSILKMVRISSLTVDPSLQIRGGINSAKVKEYCQIIREQEYMDALAVFYEDPPTPETKFYVADGFHRVEAYRLLGTEVVPCRLHVGSRSDALRYTLKKNGHHGAPLTNAEKRSAATKAVLDPEVAQLDDRQIARLIGCSPTLIGLARRGETKAETSKKRTARQERKTSGAPREVTARERKSTEAPLTKAQILAQLREWLNTEVLEEPDVAALMGSLTGEYRFVAKPGVDVILRVVGKSNRTQVEVPATMKEAIFERITVKLNRGKLTLEE